MSSLCSYTTAWVFGFINSIDSALCPYYYYLKVKYLLRFVVSYVQPVTQLLKSRTVQNTILQSTHTDKRGSIPCYINYCLKSELSIMFHCRLCSTRYTVVGMKNSSKSTSTIKIAGMKNTNNFHYEGKPSCATTKLTLFTVTKDEWDTKKDTGKSMKNVLYVLRYAKRNLSG